MPLKSQAHRLFTEKMYRRKETGRCVHIELVQFLSCKDVGQVIVCRLIDDPATVLRITGACKRCLFLDSAHLTLDDRRTKRFALFAVKHNAKVVILLSLLGRFFEGTCEMLESR